MRKNKIFHLLGFAIFAVIAAVAVFAQEWVLGLLSGGAGEALMAFAFVGATAEETIQGTVPPTLNNSETDNPIKPSVDKPSFSRKLAKIMPSKFPMDTITREMPKGQTKSDEYRYPSIRSRALSCVVQSPVTATTNEDGSFGVAEITLASAHMLSVDGNLMVPTYNAPGISSPATAVGGSSNAPASSPLLLHIVSIDRAAKKIRVIAINANGVPALPANTIMYRVGVAKDQLVAISEDPIVQPTFDSNFCQINMATISEAYFQRLQEKEVEWNMADMQESTLYDFRLQSELAMLFGAKRMIMDPDSGRPKYLMDGAVRKVGHTIDNGGNGVTERFMNSVISRAFGSNNGSDARILFYGMGFGTSLGENAVFHKQLEAGKTKVKFGITWNEIETNYGTILAKPHPAFSEVGFDNAALLLDPANFRKVVQRPLSYYDFDLESAGKQRTKDRRIDESFTLEVTNPETHALIFV